MTRFKRTFKDLVKSRIKATRKTAAEQYLENAVSMEDLERRQRELSRNGY